MIVVNLLLRMNPNCAFAWLEPGESNIKGRVSLAVIFFVNLAGPDRRLQLSRSLGLGITTSINFGPPRDTGWWIVIQVGAEGRLALLKESFDTFLLIPADSQHSISSAQL